MFEDAIAAGGFAVDVHDPQKDDPAYVSVTYYLIPPTYTIPYRSIYSRDIDNLFFASRLLSATHLAHGSIRLQRTLAAVGQAAVPHEAQKNTCPAAFGGGTGCSSP